MLILFFLTLLIGIIPLIILFLKKKQFRTAYGIVPFIWLTAIATLYELIGTVILRINTNYWFQVYTLLEFTAIYWYYLKVLGHKSRKSLKISLFIWSTVFIISFLFWDRSNKATALAINSCSISLFVFFFTFSYLKGLLENTAKDFWKASSFIFVAGFSIYYGSTILLFVFSQLLFEIGKYNYWSVNIFATLFLRTFLILGVWRMK